MNTLTDNKTFYEIPEFPDYCITRDGQVWSTKLAKPRRLRPQNSSGYPMVTLCRKGQIFYRTIHRLLLEVFVGPCPEGMLCCHKDMDKTNLALNNLRWDTPLANRQDELDRGYVRYYAKRLNWTQVHVIKYLLADRTYTRQELATLFRVSNEVIYRIESGQAWKETG
jgi:hypothetical protein